VRRLAVSSEIFNLKSWRVFKSLKVRSRTLNTPPFDGPHTTSYRSAIVSVARSCTILELFDVVEYFDIEI